MSKEIHIKEKTTEIISTTSWDSYEVKKQEITSIKRKLN